MDSAALISAFLTSCWHTNDTFWHVRLMLLWLVCVSW
jgi:hypothetical protein